MTLTRFHLASAISVLAALVGSDAFAASPLHVACADEQKVPGRALVCEYSVLGRSNAELADLHDKITASGKAAAFDADRLIARRDACTTVDCLDRLFEDGIREAKAVLTSPARDTPSASSGPATPPAPTAEPQSTPGNPSTATVPEVIQREPAGPPQQQTVREVAPSVPERPAERQETSTWDTFVGSLTLVALAGGAIYLIAAVWGFSTRCPECRKWFAERETNRELLDRYTDYETVRRRDERRDREGRLIDTVYREEQVAVLVRVYDVDYRCKHCGHEWRVREKSKGRS